MLFSWPDLTATRVPERREDSPYRPPFRVVYPAGQEPEPGYAAFRQTLPVDVARIVEPFESDQWLMLRLMAARAEAKELAGHNPVLVWMLANNDQFRRVLNKPPEYLAEWRLDYTQQRLAGWLGFPERNAVVNILRKIDPRGLSIPRLRLLRNALNEDSSLLKWLGHLPRIPRGVVDLVVVARLRAWISPKLLAEIAGGRGDETGGFADRLMGVLHESDEREVPLRERCLETLTEVAQVEEELRHAIAEQNASLEALRRIREAQYIEDEARCARELNNQQMRNLFGGSINPESGARKYRVAPPPSDTEDILRIRTVADARREGEQQENCVGDSASEIAAGRLFVYRVMKPERATLELRVGEDGHWHVAQLAMARNRAASRATKARVARWLDQYRAEINRDRALGKYSVGQPLPEILADETPF